MKKTYHNALSYGSLENGISVHTTLWNLALWILKVFVQILLNVNLESNSPEILTLCETNLDDSIDSENFSLKFSFNLKGFCYSYAWSCSLCEGRTSFCTGRIPRKLYEFLCFQVPLLHSVSFFFCYRLLSSSLCTDFDAVSSNTDGIFSINPSTNAFVFGDLESPS